MIATAMAENSQPAVSIWGSRSGSRASCKSDIPALLPGHYPKVKISIIRVSPTFDLNKGNRKLDAVSRARRTPGEGATYRGQYPRQEPQRCDHHALRHF